jgi:octaprenyl-diphosphate synthase
VSAADLFPAINDDLHQVDQVIRARLHSDVALINTVSEYIIQSGGKRLRPVLLLLFARAAGYTGKHHHLLAAVIEFIHTATLLHDDVVDESPMRRGRATANAGFGNAAAVLVGDFLYSRAFQMMVIPQDMRVMQILSDATNVIAEGEVLQLMNIADPDVDEARYMQVIRYKTAKLFEAAAQLGVRLAGSEEAAIELAGEYGRSLGTAFQVIDDVLDYAGDTDDTGKVVGNDLREGKPTLPLIYVMQQGQPEEKALVRDAISNGGVEDIAPILKAIKRTGALEYARGKAESEAARARETLTGLPPSVFKDALVYLTHLAVDRKS